MQRALFVLLACGLLPGVHAGTRDDPAMPPPREQLPPVLASAKQELRAIVSRRDMAALLARVRPDTKLDFGGSEGREGFLALWAGGPESRQHLWRTLDGILSLPGVVRDFDGGVEYCAPYVFCDDLPGSIDPFQALVVLGSGVAIRDRASADGLVLARVDYAVLARADMPGAEPSLEWTRVRLADGTTGYASNRWLRSPIDFRLALRMDETGDRWWLGFLLSGD